MPLSHIEHLLVAADDIDATRDGYIRVLVDVVHIGSSWSFGGST